MEDAAKRQKQRESEAQLWPGQAPPGLLLPSYSLSFSFYRVPNYVWMERPRAKISRQWRFLPLPTRSTIRKRWHPRGECARAKGRKEGRRNRLPASPLSQIGQKHDDKCGIEYRDASLRLERLASRAAAAVTVAKWPAGRRLGCVG